MKLVRCSKCNAEIFFVLFLKKDGSEGKVGPIDAEMLPAGEGNLHIEYDQPRAREVARIIPLEQRANEKYAGRLRISHFVTCPYSAQFRKGGPVGP